MPPILLTFGKLLGMDGYILMAFILGLPANEIVIPIIIMSYMSAGSMLEIKSGGFKTAPDIKRLDMAYGVCVMLFSLMHFPCGTTLWTIKKPERRWTLPRLQSPPLRALYYALRLPVLPGFWGWLNIIISAGKAPFL